MGTVVGKNASSNETNQDNSQKNKDIDNMLRKEKMEQQRTLKLLLLGAAESGKSTFAKQMRILHQNGFTLDDRQNFKHIIHTSILQTMADIVHVLQKAEFNDLDIKDAEFQDIQNDMKKLLIYKEAVDSEMMEINTEIADLITMFWKRQGTQDCVERGNEFCISEAVVYFMGRLNELSKPDYLPTDQDILHVRMRTLGVIETMFSCKGYTIRLFDVGGQRSERRKWIHCFDNVTAIIFTAAMSEYDQVLAEDYTVNRMHESINLFTSICNNFHFLRTSMILFLNKKDIFEIKIKTKPITIAFPHYEGDNSYDSLTVFIKQTYESVKQSKDKVIYTHFTNATDTENINFVFDAMMSVVMRNNLEAAGMF